ASAGRLRSLGLQRERLEQGRVDAARDGQLMPILEHRDGSARTCGQISISRAEEVSVACQRVLQFADDGTVGEFAGDRRRGGRHWRFSRLWRGSCRWGGYWNRHINRLIRRLIRRVILLGFFADVRRPPTATEVTMPKIARATAPSEEAAAAVADPLSHD